MSEPRPQDRRPRLPRVERRPRRGLGAHGARRRARLRLARRGRAPARGRRRPSGRLLLRRLPALRRHRPLCARAGGRRSALRTRAGSCSGSATASRSSARPASSRACCGRTSRSRSSAATWACAWSEPTRPSRHAAHAGQRLVIPVKHGEGCFYADGRPPGRARGSRPQIVLRYEPGENPNGSVADIAGVVNEDGNVMGLMPHPEHAVDPLLGQPTAPSSSRRSWTPRASASTRAGHSPGVSLEAEHPPPSRGHRVQRLAQALDVPTPHRHRTAPCRSVCRVGKPDELTSLLVLEQLHDRLEAPLARALSDAELLDDRRPPPWCGRFGHGATVSRERSRVGAGLRQERRENVTKPQIDGRCLSSGVPEGTRLLRQSRGC